MKRYRVAIKNSKENRVELTFTDLCVKYSNGFSPTLKVKEGEEIPLSVCDPEDIRKSWIVGSLKGYLENKWIEEICDENTLPIQSTPLSHFITESMVLAPKIVPAKAAEPVLPAKIDVPPQPILPEVAKEEKSKVSEPIVESLTDLSLVKSYDDFNRLSHTLKLRFIKDCTDVALLKDLSGKTSSVQFKNNISLRLTQIKI